MAILNHFEAALAEERAAYLKQASTLRRSEGDEMQESGRRGGGQSADDRDAEPRTLRRDAVGRSNSCLTVSSNGFGKRSSSFEFRTSGRGGKGIVAMVVNRAERPLLASFPSEENDQIMLVTDGGQLIRVPVQDISVMGRSTQGVIVFSTAEGERVVSVEHIPDENGEESGGV